MTEAGAPVRLGLAENRAQFALLVGLNGLVGAMVGLERSVLPLVGERDFHVGSTTAVLAFIVAFGAAKALMNLAAGRLADRAGRRPVLLAGWALALPVPLLLALAPSWGVVVAANALLGASQGLAWSMTVLMKIDLVGERRRGLALGLNESSGYVGLAIAATVTGALAGAVAPRTVVWVGATATAIAGLALTAFFVRETAEHVELERRLLRPRPRERSMLAACGQAGFVNNLNDALAWGLVPLYLAAAGASPAQIGAVAGVYPAVWGLGQLVTGALSDAAGRRPLIVVGMLTQGVALAMMVGFDGRFTAAVAAAAVLGLGTALVYPVLLAAVSDAVSPSERARALAVYRFWRDSGLVAGAVAAGIAADTAGAGAAILAVAGLTAASGIAFLLMTTSFGRRASWRLT
jgi:MFS family permease